MHSRAARAAWQIHDRSLRAGSGGTAILALVSVFCDAFVKRQAKIPKCLQNQLYAAFYLALFVGILDAQEEHTAGLMRQALIYQRTIQVAQMHKTGRTRTHTSDLCALRQISFRIAGLDLLRCLGDVRKQQLC